MLLMVRLITFAGIYIIVTSDGQYPGSNEAEMMKQMSLSDGGGSLPNNQGYNPPMMNKEYQT